MDEFTRPSDEEIKNWQTRLIGKYLLESDEQFVGLAPEQIVRSSAIPKPNQILPPGAPQIRNYLPGRMNVFLDDNKKITQVYFG
ncbi:hypothetical protein BCR42DRAFT_407697 [Absidia repens]|uniref:Uncharacterized protein n=1 Tax=Absidia repens TaxID=90262 RepID=A0A1X2IU87_9FUNG|nr:hypothetical protein BCR42DRAFT_407697 [Absidia repens]